jgi:hypothetical protein
MIQRRREKRTLDALEDLVNHLGGVREERKAIITISDGWLLFRPNPNLQRRLNCQVPGKPEIYIDPATGKLTTKDNFSDPIPTTLYECERDRMRLAQLDHDERFRRLLDLANRANASFYTIDPRGLPVFDTPMGPGPLLAPSADSSQLRARTATLRTLAEATDGIAVVNNNDIDAGIRRIVDDLSSYYLLGYYSTNQKLDGRFRSIKVRVRRPAVEVRARRGYRAPTAEEVAAARRAPVDPVTPDATIATKAIDALSALRPDAQLRAYTAAVPRTPGPGKVMWVVGEIDSALARSPEWRTGGEAEANVVGPDGAAVTSAKVAVASGARSFLLRIPIDTEPLQGDYIVRLRVRSSNRGSLPIGEVMHVPLAETQGSRQALVFRRGPSTGTRFEPTADLRFRRTERIRVEVPLPEDGAKPGGRLLNKLGVAMELPVVVATRQDPSGPAWISGELALAPLAPGDYAIELGFADGSTQRKAIAPFRLVP